MSKIIKLFSAGLLFLGACNITGSSDVIATDPESIKEGNDLFDQNCSGCHNFLKDGIGPNLSGITTKTSPEWIRQFIQDPKGMVQGGDKRANQLFQKYHTLMPSFTALDNVSLNKILAFLHAHKKPVQAHKTDLAVLKNPIPDSISSSGIEIGLELFSQIPPSGKELPFTRIVKLDFAPHSGSLFVLDQRGKLFKLSQNKPEVFLDMAKWKKDFINQPGLATGFGSFAFHPDYEHNRLLYTTHSDAPKSKKADFGYADSIPVTLQWVVSEWKTESLGKTPFKGTSRELLRIDMVAGIHGVQELAFNPNAKKGDEDYGQLFIGIGDGGSVENGYPFLAHRTDRIWGTIIRIDPSGINSRNKQYGISAQNPFVRNEDSNIVKEIYAYGFRNPNRITWTRSNQMLATNIGQAHIESLNKIVKGHDYGWPIREGSFVIKPDANLNNVYAPSVADRAILNTQPVVQYDHDEGKAISGGFQYEGKAVPDLRGKFLFGDVPTGRLFYVDMADLQSGKPATIKEWHVSMHKKQQSLRELCGNDRVDLHFGKDQAGEMYILTKPDGKIYKLVQLAK